MRRIFSAVALFATGGCAAVGDAADRLGSYMPVIGERCAHWQCITESGRQRSEINKNTHAADSTQEIPENAGHSRSEENPMPR